MHMLSTHSHMLMLVHIAINRIAGRVEAQAAQSTAPKDSAISREGPTLSQPLASPTEHNAINRNCSTEAHAAQSTATTQYRNQPTGTNAPNQPLASFPSCSSAPAAPRSLAPACSPSSPPFVAYLLPLPSKVSDNSFEIPPTPAELSCARPAVITGIIEPQSDLETRLPQPSRLVR